jgi:membrane protease YdiL (CAAX protease family)
MINKKFILQNCVVCMGFSRQFWIFLGLSCLEFVFLLGPALFYKFVKKETIRTSILLRSFPHKRSVLARIGDITVGISSGIFLNFIAQGLLFATYYGIIAVFGENFYGAANSGSIDLSPDGNSIGEVICTILIYCVIVGFCEEYFFRSVLFVGLKKILKNWSYLINGILFALFHIFPGIVPIQTTITYFLYYFILGILLCILLDYQENDVLSNIIAHGVFNSLPLILRLF